MSEKKLDYFKLPFEVLNPYLKVKSGNQKLTANYLQQISPFVSIACGLAIRQVGDN